VYLLKTASGGEILQAPLQKAPLGLVGRERQRAAIRLRSRVLAIQPPQQISARRMQQVSRSASAPETPSSSTVKPA